MSEKDDVAMSMVRAGMFDDLKQARREMAMADFMAVEQERERCVAIAKKYADDEMLGPEARLCAAYISREISQPQTNQPT